LQQQQQQQQQQQFFVFALRVVDVTLLSVYHKSAIIKT
jgi:hypothetical protein